MGGSTSRNVVENLMRSQVSVVDTTSNGMYTTLSNNVNVQICADNGSTVEIDGDIDIKQFAKFNADATLTAVSSAEVSQKMSQQAEQQAKSIAQQFSLSNADASNVARLCMEISTSVRNSISQVISSNISNLTTVTVCATNNSDIKYKGAISVEQGMEVFQKYVISATIDTKASVDLQQIVKQKATAITESMLGQLAIIVVAVCAVIGVVMFTGAKRVTEPKFMITIFIMVLISVALYLGAAYLFKFPPFKRKAEDTTTTTPTTTV